MTLAPGFLAGAEKDEKSKVVKPAQPEWRNKQEGVAYRMPGRTGMMVSELVIGTFPFDDESCYPVLDYGIDRGINYVDTAAYSSGKIETNLGKYFKQPGKRDKVFLSTKQSYYYGYIDRVIKEIEAGLPEGVRL